MLKLGVISLLCPNLYRKVWHHDTAQKHDKELGEETWYAMNPLSSNAEDLRATFAQREAEHADLEIAHMELEERYTRLQVDTNIAQILIRSPDTVMHLEWDNEDFLRQTSLVLELARHVRIGKLHRLQSHRALVRLHDDKSRAQETLVLRENVLAVLERRMVEAESFSLLTREHSFKLQCTVHKSKLPESMIAKTSLGGCSLRTLGPFTCTSPTLSLLQNTRVGTSSRGPDTRFQTTLRNPTVVAANELRGMRHELKLALLGKEIAGKHAIALARAVELNKQRSHLPHNPSTIHFIAKCETDELRQAQHYAALIADRDISLSVVRLASSAECSVGNHTRASAHALTLDARVDLVREQLQRSATATVTSLKAVIAEKNRALERANFKLAKLQKFHGEAAADMCLTQSRFAEHDGALTKLRCVVNQTSARTRDVEDDATRSISIKIVGQISAENAKLRQSIATLEAHLRAARAARVRSEATCREAFREIKAQKHDLATLANRLHVHEATRQCVSNFTRGADEVQLRGSLEKQNYLNLRTTLESCRKLKAAFARTQEQTANTAAKTKELLQDDTVCILRRQMAELRQHLGIALGDALYSRQTLYSMRSRHAGHKRRYCSLCRELEVISYTSTLAETRALQLDNRLRQLRHIVREICRPASTASISPESQEVQLTEKLECLAT